jgi:hypothetical protein
MFLVNTTDQVDTGNPSSCCKPIEMLENVNKLINCKAKRGVGEFSGRVLAEHV